MLNDAQTFRTRSDVRFRMVGNEAVIVRQDAAEVIELYVRSAYSPIPPSAEILDRLRKFWFEFERVRNKYLR